jgi:uncharacterized membrane protein
VTVCCWKASSFVHVTLLSPTLTWAGFGWKASAVVVLLAEPETIEIVLLLSAEVPATIVAVMVATVVVFLAVVVVLVFAAQNGDGWNALDVGELVAVSFAATN